MERPQVPVDPAAVRIAYLLADPGIAFTESRKGCSIHVRSLIRAFEQEGAEVESYVLRRGGGPVGEFRVRQVRASRLRKWWAVRMLDRGGWRRFAPWLDKSTPAPNWMTAVALLLMQRDFLRHALRRLQRRPPDFLYARSSWFTWPYARLKRRLGVPLVVEVNATLSIEKAVRGELAFPRLTRRMEREMFLAADLILPVTEELRRQVESFGVPPERIVVTPNAVDPDLFASAAKPFSKETFTVGFVGSMKAYHGVAVLLRAAALLRGDLPGLRVLAIGGGPELQSARNLAADLHVDDIVEFPGVTAHDQVPELLRRCDVCVAPYLGPENLYGCPMKLFEYMALEKPIVAADWGDIPNILTHGQTALLHPEGDAEALAVCLRDVHDHPDEARRKADRARRLVDSHTWDSVARRILDWYAARAETPGNISSNPS